MVYVARQRTNTPGKTSNDNQTKITRFTVDNESINDIVNEMESSSIPREEGNSNDDVMMPRSSSPASHKKKSSRRSASRTKAIKRLNKKQKKVKNVKCRSDETAIGNSDSDTSSISVIDDVPEGVTGPSSARSLGTADPSVANSRLSQLVIWLSIVGQHQWDNSWYSGRGQQCKGLPRR